MPSFFLFPLDTETGDLISDKTCCRCLADFQITYSVCTFLLCLFNGYGKEFIKIYAFKAICTIKVVGNHIKFTFGIALSIDAGFFLLWQNFNEKFTQCIMFFRICVRAEEKSLRGVLAVIKEDSSNASLLRDKCTAR